MKALFSVVLLLLYGVHTVVGRIEACSYSCINPMFSITFKGDDPLAEYYVHACSTLLRLQSLYLCFQKHCSQAEIDKGLDVMKEECGEYGLEPLPYSIIENITQADEKKLKVLQFGDLTTGDNVNPEIYDTPIVLGDELWGLSTLSDVGGLFCAKKLGLTLSESME